MMTSHIVYQLKWRYKKTDFFETAKLIWVGAGSGLRFGFRCGLVYVSTNDKTHSSFRSIPFSHHRPQARGRRKLQAHRNSICALVIRTLNFADIALLVKQFHFCDQPDVAYTKEGRSEKTPWLSIVQLNHRYISGRLNTTSSITSLIASDNTWDESAAPIPPLKMLSNEFTKYVYTSSCSYPFGGNAKTHMVRAAKNICILVSFSAQVLWYGLEKPVITSGIGNWSVFVLFGWRFVFGIIMKWDRREPHIVRCHHGSGGNIQAASLLRLLRLNRGEYSPRTSLIGRPAKGYSVSPPSHLINGVDGRTK